MNRSLLKTVLSASAKSIDPGQPAQSAQADLGRKFLPLVNCIQFIGTNYRMNYSVVKTESKMKTESENKEQNKRVGMRSYA